MIIKFLGTVEYLQTWTAMRELTLQRDAFSEDEIWIVEHPPVFTLGRAGKISNLLKHSAIPLIKTDRGGDITYHGPGQLVVYTLIDIRRLGLGMRAFTKLLEQSTLSLLNDFNITAYRLQSRPGIYTDQGKIAALGLHCKKFGTYHGISININVDKSAYNYINPCGIKQPISQLADWIPVQKIDVYSLGKQWLQHFQQLITPQT